MLLLLNVMMLFSVVRGALLDRPCMVFHKVCVCCASSSSVRLDAPSNCVVCVLNVGSDHLNLEFESWITGVCSPYVLFM